MPGPVHEWWPKISEESRQWLVTNLRKPLPKEVLDDIVNHKGHLGGLPTSDGKREMSSDEWDEIEHPR